MFWEEQLAPALAAVIGEAAKYDVGSVPKARVRLGSQIRRRRAGLGEEWWALMIHGGGRMVYSSFWSAPGHLQLTQTRLGAR